MEFWTQFFIKLLDLDILTSDTKFYTLSPELGPGSSKSKKKAQKFWVQTFSLWCPNCLFWRGAHPGKALCSCVSGTIYNPAGKSSCRGGNCRRASLCARKGPAQLLSPQWQNWQPVITASSRELPRDAEVTNVQKDLALFSPTALSEEYAAGSPNAGMNNWSQRLRTRDLHKPWPGRKDSLLQAHVLSSAFWELQRAARSGQTHAKPVSSQWLTSENCIPNPLQSLSFLECNECIPFLLSLFCFPLLSSFCFSLHPSQHPFLFERQTKTEREKEIDLPRGSLLKYLQRQGWAGKLFLCISYWCWCQSL